MAPFPSTVALDQRHAWLTQAQPVTSTSKHPHELPGKREEDDTAASQNLLSVAISLKPLPQSSSHGPQKLRLSMNAILEWQA